MKGLGCWQNRGSDMIGRTGKEKLGPARLMSCGTAALSLWLVADSCATAAHLGRQTKPEEIDGRERPEAGEP